MKKQIISTIGLLFIVTIYAAAQWTGGGEQEKVNAKKPATLTAKDFFKIGMAIPSGDFGEKTGAKAGGAETGFMLQFGGIRYFDLGFNTDQFAVGYNYPFTFSFNNWEKNDSLPPTMSADDIKYRPYIFIGFGIGPLVSYTPSENLVIDAFFNVKPTVSMWGGYKSDNSIEEQEMYSSPALTMGTNYGINIRYAKVIFGLDFMPSEFTYNKINEVNGDEHPNSPTEIPITTSTTNLSIGILF